MYACHSLNEGFAFLEIIKDTFGLHYILGFITSINQNPIPNHSELCK